MHASSCLQGQQEGTQEQEEQEDPASASVGTRPSGPQGRKRGRPRSQKPAATVSSMLCHRAAAGLSFLACRLLAMRCLSCSAAATPTQAKLAARLPWCLAAPQYGPEVVGRRLWVWWGGDRKWYRGQIIASDAEG